MKDHHIRRIPVVDENGQVVGIISDRDVRDASPSKATTLDMYEMHYLLAELKAKNIMTAKPITVKPTDTVEQAALIMLDNKVGGLPVVDDSGKLVGIISDHDVFKALVDITGARMGFSPFLVTGVYVGYDQVQSLGRLEQGGRTAAPIFRYYRSEVEDRYPKDDFVMPEGIVMADGLAFKADQPMGTRERKQEAARQARLGLTDEAPEALEGDME